ncbi:MAG TPA: flavin reductase, partial [Streptosporangiales bacterium]
GATVVRGIADGEHERRAIVRPPDGPPVVFYQPLTAGTAPATAPVPLPPDTALGVDAHLFRHVIGHFASGVTVVTVRSDGADYGVTANAVSSLSLDPPMLLVCLNLNSVTQQAVTREGSFVVNILGEDQADLAHRFAQRRPDKFDGVPVRTSRLGHPALADVLACLECRVVEDIVGGTHRVFLAEVVHAESQPGSPLAYFRGRFGRIELAQDTEAYERLRRLVLGRELGLDEPLDQMALATRLDLPVSSVAYGLTRLVGEGLVVRDPECGYLQRALDEETADAAFAAKLVIDLGVADLAAGSATPDRLADLRSLARRTLELVADGRVDDVKGYLAASVAFQEGVIGLGGNPLLLEAYRRLSIAEIVTPALRHADPARAELAQGRLRLVDAYEDGDLDRIRAVVTRQYELAKGAQRTAIAAAGGRL